MLMFLKLLMCSIFFVGAGYCDSRLSQLLDP